MQSKLHSKQEKFKNADGVEYELLWRKPNKNYFADGLCDHPDSLNPKILVNPKLPPKRRMDVLIEEVCHAFFFDKNEKEVRKFSRTLRKLIYKLQED